MIHTLKENMLENEWIGYAWKSAKPYMYKGFYGLCHPKLVVTQVSVVLKKRTQNQQSNFVLCGTFITFLISLLCSTFSRTFYVKTRDHFGLLSTNQANLKFYLVDPPTSRTDADVESASQENRTGQFETESSTKEMPVEEVEDALNALNVVILCVFLAEVKYSSYCASCWKIHVNFDSTYKKPRSFYIDIDVIVFKCLRLHEQVCTNF